jgi:predicted NACHT family NTPase
MLDGLDEVPEAEHRREQVKAAVEGLAAVFPKLRLLVTSRTYAYQKQDWKLKDFAEAVLSPFEGAQIRAFVERWYLHVGPMRGLKMEDAQGKAAALKQAISSNPRLQELAARPLLLTLMASLHAWRGGGSAGPARAALCRRCRLAAGPVGEPEAKAEARWQLRNH